MKLTLSRVGKILDKVYSEAPDSVMFDGLTGKICADPKKLEESRAEVSELLAEFPASFFTTSGAPLSAAFQDAHGNYLSTPLTPDAVLAMGALLGMVEVIDKVPHREGYTRHIGTHYRILFTHSTN